MEIETQSLLTPYENFLYALKAEETRRKYVRRLELFFDFYKIEGNNIQEKSENFKNYQKW